MSSTREQVAEYLGAQRGRQFKLGEHDCLTFTNEVWRIMHGNGYADDLLGRYLEKGKDALREEFGVRTIQQLLDKKLARCEMTVPPFGALVTTKEARRWHTGVALGIAMGVTAVFLGEDDVIYMPIDKIEGAWL